MTSSGQLTLTNGVQIPTLGFGTWQIPDGAAAYDAVSAALAAGYRHIDTARAYGNESSVGRAIADSGLAREDVFVTTKLPAEIKDHDAAATSLQESLAALGLAYVDLYLIHAPWPWAQMGADHATGNALAWAAMEGAHEHRLARAIGVSNFAVSDLEKLIAASRLKPQVNQIKFYIGNTQDEITRYCQTHDILVEGFSPLATGSILSNADVLDVARTYDRSVAQLCIRYVQQRGVVPLPKTTTPSRMVENADLGFTITDEHMALLDGLTDTATEHHGPKPRA
ncbi:aldo/keto reductase [Cellulomonas soli]|nr:aldo/keto reductase [Cellulomonas soli]NYI60328.1 diketogulonate reductase-like aldo/keto reductase [Cellulomonas soli]